MGRAPCCDKNGLKKGPWTPEEDQKLIDYIQKHGYGNWRTLPKNAGLQRCGKSCRLRWTNYLRPDIKRGRFSFEEEETIIQLHSILGNKWSAIASRLPGRTDNEIKNYWNTHIRKRLLRMGIDPVTHSPRLDLLDLTSILSSSLYGDNNSSPINIQRLLTMHPMVNPQLLKLASSIISSQQRDESLDFTSYHNHYDNPQIQNQNQNQTQQEQQQHFVQTHQESVTCVSLPPFIEPNNDNNVNAYPFNGIALSSLTEEDYIVPQLSSYDYYSSDNNNNNNNLLVGPSSLSEASTTFHSSPTTLNSNINGSSSTEDESSSDNMLRFQIPDVLDVTQFCDNNVVSDYYYY
ncbi:hypothetical protein HN51_057742 [Arachis hypogaea]|uniref:transcription factor MYB102-like n=1 Tax=Arachis ipaensis TaxID=130454 RepID=UPI0007AF06CF|nr:transcription factor MYB102-like [Arachis ipaensis]XP_025685998.1 transcription factor MYB102 [Arachis hypogaea]QHN80842.1 uncharacterized protein DS421_20g681650 [Arachis hypogaea]